jgi:hypothetical protein
MMNYHHWCDREDQVPLARKLAREGKTHKEIAVAVGYKSENGVRQWLKRHGIFTHSTKGRRR